MTHEEVKKSDAAARYLQDALSETERQEFEEHMFDCPECAGIVKADTVLKTCGELACGKGAPEKDDEEDSSGTVLGQALEWVALHPPIAAAALLVAALAVPWAGYQSLYKIPWLQEENKWLREESARLNSPRDASIQNLNGQARGGNGSADLPHPTVKLRRGCTEVILEMEIDSVDWTDQYSEFRSLIEGESGSFEILHTALDGFMLHPLVPCSRLHPGVYELKLYGLGGETQELIGTYRFEAQLE